MTLEALDRLVGTWTTEATHPAMPGTIVRGTVVIEWLEGRKFLIHRYRNEHPDFPDGISIIGNTEHDRVAHGGDRAVDPDAAGLTMHYFDSRGVFRVFACSIDEHAWRFSRMAPGFSQRFTGTFSADGDTIVGRTELCQDDVHWADDLQITYRRAR